ncbi:MAG TPA: hypothetical protein VFE91_03835 [Nitrososphaerales archaeon]|nr:hypothetical protein [Nitrososphaerales archaeon]
MPDILPPPDLGNVVQQLAQQFSSLMSVVLSTVDSTVIQVTRLAYVSILLIGILLYFSHVERRLGKDLIKGGVVLAVLSEFVFPALIRL